jgi:hypothetical protein
LNHLTRHATFVISVQGRRANFLFHYSPTGTTTEMTKVTRGYTDAPRAAQLFGNAGREYMEKYGSSHTPEGLTF